MVTFVGLERRGPPLLEAAPPLEQEGIHAAVLDLRSVAPLGQEMVAVTALGCGGAVVVDEDWRRAARCRRQPAGRQR